MDPRYYEDATDRELVVEGIRRALALGDSPVMRAFVGPASFPRATDDAALLESARTSAVSFNHPAGSCRSGTGATSVVDPLLRVTASRAGASRTPPRCPRCRAATSTPPRS
ncbi:GMC oxidoreductase [Streptomyces sp. NPDC088768]|uniref:GMC oxidoreductase n=1 Tax=Streptomyces sp. NPDC088768 TaxID=3365894 RepID=UPI003825E638